MTVNKPLASGDVLSALTLNQWKRDSGESLERLQYELRQGFFALLYRDLRFRRNVTVKVIAQRTEYTAQHIRSIIASNWRHKEEGKRLHTITDDFIRALVRAFGGDEAFNVQEYRERFDSGQRVRFVKNDANRVTGAEFYDPNGVEIDSDGFEMLKDIPQTVNEPQPKYTAGITLSTPHNGSNMTLEFRLKLVIDGAGNVVSGELHQVEN